MSCNRVDRNTRNQLIAGGIAGGVAKTVVAPLDRINILQGHHHHYKHSGIREALQKIVRYDGYTGLFRGHGASLIRIVPYASVQFATYEYIKEVLEFRLGHHMSTKFLAGSCAGVVAATVTYPLDSIRTVIAFQPTGRVAYTGTWQALCVILSDQNGTRLLYKGFGPTVLGMVPYAGLSFCGFETLKKNSLQYFPDLVGRPCPHSGGKKLVLHWYAKLLCGALAAAFASTVSYPFGVVRRKMQLSPVVIPNSHNCKTMLATVRYVYKKRGVAGFYRGLPVAILKVVPMVAVSFCVYETAIELLARETKSSIFASPTVEATSTDGSSTTLNQASTSVL